MRDDNDFGHAKRITNIVFILSELLFLFLKIRYYCAGRTNKHAHTQNKKLSGSWVVAARR